MSTREQLLEALHDLAGTEPTVIVEPPHIIEWSVKRSLVGLPEVAPSDLERVTLVYETGRHRASVVIYDRELDIVRAFDLSEFRSLCQ